jgi:hypothetical protein
VIKASLSQLGELRPWGSLPAELLDFGSFAKAQLASFIDIRTAHGAKTPGTHPEFGRQLDAATIEKKAPKSEK